MQINDFQLVDVKTFKLDQTLRIKFKNEVHDLQKQKNCYKDYMDFMDRQKKKIEHQAKLSTLSFMNTRNKTLEKLYWVPAIRNKKTKTKSLTLTSRSNNNPSIHYQIYLETQSIFNNRSNTQNEKNETEVQKKEISWNQIKSHSGKKDQYYNKKRKSSFNFEDKILGISTSLSTETRNNSNNGSTPIASFQTPDSLLNRNSPLAKIYEKKPIGVMKQNLHKLNVTHIHKSQ